MLVNQVLLMFTTCSTKVYFISFKNFFLKLTLIITEGDIWTSQLRLAMQKVMQDHAAVFRTGDSMRTGIDKMKDVINNMKQIQIVYKQDLVWNTDLVEALELQNLITQATQTIVSGEART